MTLNMKTNDYSSISFLFLDGSNNCTTPLLYGPLDSTNVLDIEKFTSDYDPSSAVVPEDLIRFTIQIPTNPTMAAGNFE